jgi:hypothetical protein
MADGFIVRRGGKAEEVLRTATPDINFVSKTNSEIVVTFKNNDAGEAEIYYGLTAPLTDTVTLATGATSSNITFSGLAANTQFTVSAYALITDPTTKKIKSEIVSTNITTDAAVYTAATGGTTEEYDDGGKRYKSHTFTSNGTFEVTTVGDNIDDRNKVDYLIIAGGGSAGTSLGGGGGAGGYRTTISPVPSDESPDSKVTISAASYSVTIGLGGSASGSNATNGTNSSVSFPTTITSTGGGAGASFDFNAGGNGGSGGGGNQNRSFGTGILGQGRDGGAQQTSVAFARAAGSGGGGAGAVGQQAPNFDNGGNGGNGLANLLRTGSNETRAGGGGGAIGANSTGSAGTGGTGGGGAGAKNATGTAGTANTGGGGGANTASGGSGIVIIRYEIAPTV